MIELYTDLSRLLDGELSSEEARVLRERIANEPEVARAWAALQQLPGELAALPTALPDPPALSQPPAPPARASRWPWLALAASALLTTVALWRPAPVPQLALGAGEHLVDGEALVHLAGHDVAVDGRALITVEPAAGLVREDGQEEPMSALTHVATAATASLVTVAVYAGTASITNADGTATVLEADQTWQRPATEPAPAVITGEAVPSAEPPAPVAVAALQARIDELEAENASLRFENTLTSGQLALVNGEAQPWPSTLPNPSFAPDTFDDLVRTAADDMPGVTLLEVDCDEFPCIAHLDIDPELTANPHDIVSAFSDTFGDDAPGFIALINETDDGTGPTSTLSLALSSGDTALPPRVEQRARRFTEGE